MGPVPVGGRAGPIHCRTGARRRQQPAPAPAGLRCGFRAPGIGERHPRLHGDGHEAATDNCRDQADHAAGDSPGPGGRTTGFAVPGAAGWVRRPSDIVQPRTSVTVPPPRQPPGIADPVSHGSVSRSPAAWSVAASLTLRMCARHGRTSRGPLAAPFLVPRVGPRAPGCFSAYTPPRAYNGLTPTVRQCNVGGDFAPTLVGGSGRGRQPDGRTGSPRSRASVPALLGRPVGHPVSAVCCGLAARMAPSPTAARVPRAPGRPRSALPPELHTRP